MWESLGEFFIAGEQWLLLSFPQIPFPVGTLPRIRRADPVVDWSWNQTNRLGRLGFFAYDQQDLGITSLLRRVETLNGRERDLIKMQLFFESAHVPGLLSDQLG